MLPLKFPSPAEALRQSLADEAHLTPEQRLKAVCELLKLAAAMNPGDDVFGSNDPLWLRREDEWQRCMRELFQRYQPSGQLD